MFLHDELPWRSRRTDTAAKPERISTTIGPVTKRTILLLAAISVLFITVKRCAAAGGVYSVWMANYNGPAVGDDGIAIAVDAIGNVYVAGADTGVGTGHDGVVVKYSPAGAQLWIARYDGPGHGSDQLSAIALDSSANVYVTGYDTGVDPGNAYVTIKYDTNGQQLWVARYKGPGNGAHQAAAVGVAADGSVYVTGSSPGAGSDYDYATVKYDAYGNQQWVARYDGPGHALDEATALALDDDGNVYVTGQSAGVGVNYDYATVKYDSAGNQIWVARYNGPAGLGDAATGIVTDAAHNVYVVGNSQGIALDSDIATVKYNSLGQQVWQARYNGPSSGDDFAAPYKSIASDSQGNVYVAGSSTGNGSGFDYATIKYDGNGQQLWASRYNGPGNARDRASALAIDGNGGVYVTGASNGLGGENDITTVAYDPAGDLVWAAQQNGPTSTTDEGNTVVADGSGNVYVAAADFITIKYSWDAVPPTFSSPSAGMDGAAHKTIGLNAQDAQSGLATVTVASASNCTVTVAGHPVGVGGTYAFVTPPRTPQPIIATKINQSQGASITVTATDAVGNVAVLDPEVLTLRIPPGANSVSRVLQVPEGEHYVTMINGDPGVRSITTLVNGRTVQMRISSNQQAATDLGRFYHHGENTVALIAHGKPGDTAVVLLADAPGKAASALPPSGSTVLTTRSW